jgi:hypothetical protein
VPSGGLLYPQKAAAFVGGDPHALDAVLGPAALVLCPSPGPRRAHPPPPWGWRHPHHLKAALGRWQSCERDLPGGGGGLGVRGGGGGDRGAVTLGAGGLRAAAAGAARAKRPWVANAEGPSFEAVFGRLGVAPPRGGVDRSNEAAAASGAWAFVAPEKEAQRAALLARHHAIAAERLGAAEPAATEAEASADWADSCAAGGGRGGYSGGSFDCNSREKTLAEEVAKSAEVALEQAGRRAAKGRAMAAARAEAAVTDSEVPH